MPAFNAPAFAPAKMKTGENNGKFGISDFHMKSTS